MQRIVHLLAIMTLVVTAGAMSAQTAKVKAPDFAYPKTVSAQARKSLDVAMHDGDACGVVRSLLDYTLAQGAVSGDNIPACISKIDSVRAVSADPVLHAMLYTLEAVIYNNVYTSSRWVYDNRTAPLEPIPADYNEWTGGQFRHKVGALLDAALADSVALRAVPLTRYAAVVTHDRETAVYYPTLYHFVARQALSIMKGWNGREHIFPLWMARGASDSLEPFALPTLRRDPVGEKILAIYGSIISGSSRGAAPEVNARLGRLMFLQKNSADLMTFDSEQRPYLMDLYRSYLAPDGKPVSEYAADILLEVPAYGNEKREVYDAMTSFLKYYPGYWRKDCLKISIDDMSRKSVSLEAPQVMAPGVEAVITVEMNNIDRMTVGIYDVSSSSSSRDSYDFRLGTTGARKVASLPVEVTGERVPFGVRRTVGYTFERKGMYIAVPVVNGAAPRRDSFQKIYVTGFALISTNFKDRSLWAVDAMTGAPLQGVTLSVNESPYRKGSTARRLGVTGADGSLAVAEATRGVVSAVDGTDRYAKPFYIYNYNYDQPDKWMMAARGYSSLPLYHPGDTVQWTAICYEYKAGLNRPCAGKEVMAVLMNANSIAVDTLKAVTDRFGRVNGTFPIPSDGLTGRFSISVDEMWGVVSFDVSDYKLPTFRVNAPKAEQGVPSKGAVTLRGRAETYAGFPLEDAQVTVALSVAQRPRWWYPSRSYDVYKTTAVTDADGGYEVVFSDDVFATSPLPGGYYTALVTVTSSTGESQTGTVSFSLGERYIIKAAVVSSFDLTLGSLPVGAQLVNYEDSTVAGQVSVGLVGPDSVTVSSMMIGGKGSIDVTSCRQGKYRLVMSHENADTVRREVVLYDPASTESPCPDRLIWAPSYDVSVKGDAGASWLYAVNCDTHMLVTLWDSDSIISQNWVKASKGFNRLPVRLPTDVDNATLTVSATGNYHQDQATVTVKRADSDRLIRIVAETFRDRTVPGSEESWTFRITGRDGKGREAAVIADMYNTALDVLSTFSWSFRPQKGYMPGFSVMQAGLSGNTNSYYSVPVKSGVRLRCSSLLQPDFETYGQSLAGRYYGGRRFRAFSLAAGAVKNEMKMADTEELEEIIPTSKVYDAGTADMAAPMLADNVVVREHSEEIAVEEADGEAGGAAAPSGGDAAPFAYRDSNVPLAFFRPSLVTDRDGRLELIFTVPDANTTWGFRALAFTDSLLSATFSRDVVASKEVMVQPNLPRFLRTGDRAVIKASVMNATDDSQCIMTDIELFNPATGENLLAIHRPDTIAAHGHAVVETEVVVAQSDMPFIGYRIKSSSATFADGEQALIPVLPSVTPVIETLPFYMGAEQHELSMQLPDMPSGGRVTLQFCENPAWYVVTALPGLLNNESSTAPDAARAIFSASVAAGLLRDNPVIADALKEWSDGDRSSEMLTSMLERNEELKIVLLNATPWMLDAKNDTERMTRLSLLFDRKTIDKTLSENIALLGKLSCKGGGWAWCTRYPEASQWVTRTVLSLMGRLSQLGFMPDNGRLAGMLSAALSWDTSETYEDFRKYRDGDYTDYVYVHDMFVNAGFGKPDATIVNAVTQRILSRWKNATLADKAVYARVLYRHDYRTVSRSLLASIREYAQVTPEKGMWFPSLDDAWYGTMDKVGITSLILETFHMIDPGCADIDLLRQWLILRKGAQNWGSSSTATDVVAAILGTSARWIAPAQGAVVKIGGKKLEPASFERMTGEFEMSMPSSEASGRKLSVSRKSDTPSWGAVFNRYTGDMTSVKSASCPELSIEKYMPDTLTVGDKVTVRLVVKTGCDMDYIAIIDDRPACLEPVEQLPSPIYAEGLCFYRENRDSSTRIFIRNLPKGTYVLEYEMWVNNSGSFTSGIATAQSEYAPRFSAHSSGGAVIVQGAR